MSDVKVKTRGTFSQLYQAIKTARGGEHVKGGKVLYLKNTADKYPTVSATNFRAGQAGHQASALIYESIEREYGGVIAKSVFKRVLGRDDANHAKVSLDELRALRKLLRYEPKLRSYRGKGIEHATFTKMRNAVERLKTEREEDGEGDFKPGKHLRFTAKKGLYIHTSRSTGFKNWFGFQTSRQDKRAAAGTAIWKAIAEEHSASTADKVFSKVFGDQAFDTSGADHKIAVTMGQFEAIEYEIKNISQAERDLNDAKRFLDTIEHTRKASPLDALAALFGPPQDIGTEAALGRLEEIATPGVIETLRQRPKALLDYMRNKDRLLSLLERAAEKLVDDDAKNDIIANYGVTPEQLAVNETWAAVFGRTPSGHQNFPDSEPVDQTLTDQNIRALVVTARLQALCPPFRERVRPVMRLCLWGRQDGITYFQRTWSYNNKHKMYPGLSLGDVRAFDDLVLIGGIMGAAEKGEIDLDKESPDMLAMLARRTAEIRTRFEHLLENDRKKKLEHRTFISTLQSWINEVKTGSADFDDKRDVVDLFQTWQSMTAKIKDVEKKIASLDRLMAPEEHDRRRNENQRMNDEYTLDRLKDQFPGRNEKEIHETLIDVCHELLKSLAPTQETYQDYDWTKSMVREYEHLGFRDDVNYLEQKELDKLKASLRTRELSSSTVETLNNALKQAEKFERQLLDAGGPVRADPKQTQISNNTVPERQISEPPQQPKFNVHQKIDIDSDEKI